MKISFTKKIDDLKIDDDRIRQSLEDAEASIIEPDGEPTQEFTMYQQYKQTYLNTRTEYNKAYASAISDPAEFSKWPITGVQYQDNIDKAWSDWIGLGFKHEIEKSISILSAQGINIVES